MILLKGLRFIFILSFFSVLGFFLANYPGSVKADWFGYSITVPMGLFVAATVLLFILCNTLLTTWKLIWSLPQKYLERIHKKRIQKGYNLLVDGLSAIAAGQNDEAKEIMSLATELIPDDSLTQFIAAQASYMTGDEEGAIRQYLALIKNRRTSFLGFRGLLMQAKERGDYHLAQEYINKSLALRPDSPWLQTEYLSNAIKLAQKGVFAEIEKNKLVKYVPKTLWHRHKAMLYWLKLQSNLPINHLERERLHLKVLELAPDWIYNVKQLVELYIRNDFLSKAQKIIQESFKKTPHRILGELWDTVFCDMQPVDRYRTMEKLVSGNEEHPESQFSLAESAIKAQLWGQAEKHLDQFLSHGLTRTGCNLMAELTEKRYPTQFDLAREWWKKSAQVTADYTWQCTSCHSLHNKWDLICNNCQEVDQIYWQQSSTPHRTIKGEIENVRLANVV